MAFDRSQLQTRLADLAHQQIHIGTSSWKYPGWCGSIYEEERYLTRGKFSESRFNRDCLTEYAETFPAVCVDAGYYRFPTEKYLTGLAEQVPDHFRFGFKVTDEITIKHFPKLARFGDRAGKPNDHFLNARLFASAFLKPMEAIRDKVGVLILEFSQFYPRDFERGRDFVDALDRFFQEAPTDWPLAVEIRNKGFLKEPYFEMLQRHQVAHCYNNWTRMPTVGEQLAMEESFPADFTTARFLLTPGRQYQQAVDRFQPYDRLQAPDAEARESARTLMERIRAKQSARPSFLFVNNRLEGHAPSTIEAITA